MFYRNVKAFAGEIPFALSEVEGSYEWGFFIEYLFLDTYFFRVVYGL